jgi:phosphoribosylamine--glycine ligase
MVARSVQRGELNVGHGGAGDIARRGLGARPACELSEAQGTGNRGAAAQARAYQAVDRIRWPEGFCRRDIGWRAVTREKG